MRSSNDWNRTQKLAKYEVYLDNLPSGFSETRVYTLISSFNGIYVQRVLQSGDRAYCFLLCETRDVASAVISFLNEKIVMGRKLHAELRTLPNVNEEGLKFPPRMYSSINAHAKSDSLVTPAKLSVHHSRFSSHVKDLQSTNVNALKEHPQFNKHAAFSSRCFPFSSESSKCEGNTIFFNECKNGNSVTSNKPLKVEKLQFNPDNDLSITCGLSLPKSISCTAENAPSSISHVARGRAVLSQKHKFQLDCGYSVQSLNKHYKSINNFKTCDKYQEQTELSPFPYFTDSSVGSCNDKSNVQSIDLNKSPSSNEPITCSSSMRGSYNCQYDKIQNDISFDENQGKNIFNSTSDTNCKSLISTVGKKEIGKSNGLIIPKSLVDYVPEKLCNAPVANSTDKFFEDRNNCMYISPPKYLNLNYHTCIDTVASQTLYTVEQMSTTSYQASSASGQASNILDQKLRPSTPLVNTTAQTIQHQTDNNNLFKDNSGNSTSCDNDDDIIEYSKVLKICNFPYWTTEEELFTLFQDYEPLSVWIEVNTPR